MAASLVADYISSSSESDNDDVESSRITTQATHKELCEQDSTEKAVNFFENQSSDEDDNISASAAAVENAGKLPSPFANSVALPPPTFSRIGESSSSVFVTAFHRAEEAKQSILERHVKMTTFVKEETRPSKKIKSICRNFQLGKCRFGRKCRYNHDLTATEDSPFPFSETPPPGPASVLVSHQMHYQEPAVDDFQDVDDEDGVKAKRRKRAGVTNSLIPPKKALVALDHLRAVEKPWTTSLKK